MRPDQRRQTHLLLAGFTLRHRRVRQPHQPCSEADALSLWGQIGRLLVDWLSQFELQSTAEQQPASPKSGS